MLKLGAAAGVAAGGAALGLAPTSAAASAVGPLPTAGQVVGTPNIPAVPVVNNAVSNMVGYSDLQAINGILTYVSSSAYCFPSGPGSGNPWVEAPIDVPPGATLVGVTPFGTSSAGQTWNVIAQNLLTGVLTVPTGFSGSTVAGVNQFVNLSGSFTVPLYTRLNIYAIPSADSANVVKGVAYFYIPAVPGFHAIAPIRVFDSRISAGPISGGQTSAISVATSTGGGAAVPPAASAILFNLTVTSTVGSGFLALFPNGTTWPGNSSINWSATGQTVANAGDVSLGGDRMVNAYCAAGIPGSNTHFIIDVTGYFL